MQHPPHSETSHLLGTSLETPRRDRPRWVLAQMAGGRQEHPVLLGRPGLRGGTSPWPTWGTALTLPRRSALLLWSPSVVHVYVLAARYLTEQEEREQSRNVPLAHPPPASSCLPWRYAFHLHAGAGPTAPKHSWLVLTNAGTCEGIVYKSVKNILMLCCTSCYWSACLNILVISPGHGFGSPPLTDEHLGGLRFSRMVLLYVGHIHTHFFVTGH